MRLTGRGWAMAILVLGVTGSTKADAHFALVSPPSWIAEDKLGDPQKLGPCGGTFADPGKPTGVVTEARGGQKLHITVNETIYHPGHYRIALAVNARTELPPDPAVTMYQTEKGPRSKSGAIMSPVAPPVLVDGLWPHTSRPTAPWETDIDLPNINCEKCTLQVVQFMAEHPGFREGGFTYHHCADLKITADRSKPIDNRWPSAGR